MSDTGEKPTNPAYNAYGNKWEKDARADGWLSTDWLLPKYSKWEGDWLGITFTPYAGREPNWFRRVMTSWAFGVKWTKKEKQND